MIRSVSLCLVVLFLVVCGFSEVYGQKSCRTRSCKGKPAARPTSSVFIQVTDETNGRLVTYQKEFKLDHIPPGLRDRYIEHLEDSLLYSGTEDFRFTGSVGGNARRRPPAAAPRYNAVKKSSRVAGMR